MHQVVAYKRLKTMENSKTKSGFKIEKSKAKQVSCQKQASHFPKTMHNFGLVEEDLITFKISVLVT